MDWCDGNLVSTGSRDNTIKTFDIRANRVVSVLEKHSQEICGLKWNFNETYLTSGGNENNIYIWDIRKSNPVKYFSEHKAAVRALAWSPHSYSTLVSGGGNSDKTIRFWNLNREESVAVIDAESQVCNLLFSKHSNELVSTHGYSSNQIAIWDVDKKEKITVLEGHTQRVLHVALSPDSESIATCASDETLKFWKVFPREEKEHKSELGFKNVFLELR